MQVREKKDCLRQSIFSMRPYRLHTTNYLISLQLQVLSGYKMTDDGAADGADDKGDDQPETVCGQG